MTNDRPKPGYKQTEVGMIPEDWDIRAVADICDFIVPGRNKPRIFKGDIPWITTPDLENGRGVSESKLGLFVSRDEAKSVGSKIVPSGAVLMSCVGELGIVAFVEREIVINQQLHAFIPTSVIDPLFLLNALQSQKNFMLSIATLTAVPYLNKDNCNSIPIPLPSLPEQRSISQALSDVDALIAALDKAIGKKRAIKTATMQQLLTGKKRLLGFGEGKGDRQTEIGVIPEDWRVTQLKELIDQNRKITYGIVVPGSNISNGIPMIRAQDYSRGWVDINELYRVATEIDNAYKRSKVIAGDILLTIVGSVGNLAKVPFIFSGSNLTQQTARLAFNKSIADADFYLSILCSSFGQREILNYTKSGVQPSLNLSDVDKFRVPYPSLPEQRAIATVLSDMDTEIAALETRLAKTQSVKQGMMQQLLTGKVRLKIEAGMDAGREDD